SFKRRSDRSALRQDDIRLEADEFFGIVPRAIDVGAAPTDVRLQIAAFDPTQSSECLRKPGKLRPSLIIVLYAHQDGKAPRHARLLSATDRRPSRRRHRAEKFDKLASLHCRSEVEEAAVYQSRTMLRKGATRRPRYPPPTSAHEWHTAYKAPAASPQAPKVCIFSAATSVCFFSAMA